MRRRRSRALGVLVIVLAVVFAGIIFAAFNRAGDDSPRLVGLVPTPTPPVVSNSPPGRLPGEPTGLCELPPDGEFALAYQNHTGGFVIDAGIPGDPEGAKLRILEVSKHDPIVLRHFLNELALQFPDRVRPVPEDKDLTNLENRKEEWLRLCNWLQTLKFTISDLRGPISNVVMNDVGNVSITPSQTQNNEQQVQIFLDEDNDGRLGDHERRVAVRRICGNVIREEVIITTPVKTPVPTPVACIVSPAFVGREENDGSTVPVKFRAVWFDTPNFPYRLRWLLNGIDQERSGEEVTLVLNLNVQYTITVQVINIETGRVVCLGSVSQIEGSQQTDDDPPGTEPINTAAPTPAPSSGTDPNDCPLCQ